LPPRRFAASIYKNKKKNKLNKRQNGALPQYKSEGARLSAGGEARPQKIK
jgi:hypothetical protein